MPRSDVTGWILAGGEGRRMGGANKGLQVYRGQALVLWVIQSLAPQTNALHINAKREQAAYAQLLGGPSARDRVWPDDADISRSLGPLAGILTGLRHITTPWLVTAACDTPALPAELVERLHQHAADHGADIAVPVTHDAPGETRHHWTCALIHTRTRASLETALVQGERRVGQWIKTCPWIGVSFDDPAAFININTPEALRGQA
ncbi:MAG: molybdenum cofactor guanylyltransferase [Rubrivivax sp.]|nr:MAG: molybdenum cofactor guanylyltransferase [Rubrivivax sp.]